MHQHRTQGTRPERPIEERSRQEEEELKELPQLRSPPGEQGQAHLMTRKSEGSGLAPLYFLGAQNMLEVSDFEPTESQDPMSWS